MYIVFRSQENLDNVKNALFINIRPEDHPNGLWFSGDIEAMTSSDLIPIDIDVSKNIEAVFLSADSLTIYSRNQHMMRKIVDRKSNWSFYQWIVVAAVELSIFED